jgi:hypothetical protein
MIGAACVPRCNGLGWGDCLCDAMKLAEAFETERIACYRKNKRDRRLDLGPWTDR